MDRTHLACVLDSLDLVRFFSHDELFRSTSSRKPPFAHGPRIHSPRPPLDPRRDHPALDPGQPHPKINRRSANTRENAQVPGLAAMVG